MILSVTTKYDYKIKNATQSFSEYFNTPQFWYNKLDNAGYLGSISNHPAWTEYFAAQELYQRCPLLCHSKFLRNGVLIFNNEEPQKFLNQDIVQTFYKQENEYHSQVWFVIVNKTENGSDQLGFLVKKSLLPLVINELPLIRLFMKKLPINLGFVFSKLEEAKINIIDLIGNSFQHNSGLVSPQHSTREAFMSQMGMQGDFKLTPKEIGIIKLILQGYSPREIAPKVFLAKRTIEHNIERIKEKLGCYSKQELVQKAQEMECCGYFI